MRPCQELKNHFGWPGPTGSSDSPIVAKQMRRLFEPRGGPARHAVPTATDPKVESDGGNLYYGTRKKRRKESPRGPSNQSQGANRKNGGGQVLTGFYRHTGERNRTGETYTCDSEDRRAPKCPQRKQGEPVSMPSPPPAKEATRSPFPLFQWLIRPRCAWRDSATLREAVAIVNNPSRRRWKLEVN